MAARRLLQIALSITLTASVSNAQNLQPAECNATTGYGWASNSLGQDPCHIASSVGSVCQPAHNLIIPALPNALDVYSGPTSQNQSTCLCNSVYYSLLMVCALCQGGSPNPWSHYKANCGTIFVGVLPVDIPSDTLIPAWAYDNVTAKDGVDVGLALTQTSLPESSPPASPASTSPVPAQTTTSAASHKSMAGAIAGGVVGGLVLLALVAGGAFFYLKRRRRSGGPRILDLNRDELTPTTFNSSPVYGMAEVPKLYNPSDPSTFPTSPVNSSLYTTEPQNSFIHQDHPPPPQFSGAAEI